MIILAIVAMTVFGAYWRRCKGGGWWAQGGAPWWAARGLLYLWLAFTLAWVLYAIDVGLTASLVLAALFALSWNPGPAGLSMGRDDYEPEYARKKPIGRLVAPLADLVAVPGTAGWCVVLLGLDYGLRDILIAAAGAYLIGPTFAAYALAGLCAGSIYDIGWVIWDRGWRPVFLQPGPDGTGGANGQLIGEWLLGGWRTGALVTLAYVASGA